jgi:hypothetical protein
MVTPELQQNILVTLYLLFEHNYEAMAYFLGMCLGGFLAFFRPSRFATLVLFGFGILLFSYEYDKHIVEALREQTVKSLITVTPHFRLERYVSLTITTILPVLLFVLGWACILVAVTYAAMHLGKERKKSTGK